MNRFWEWFTDVEEMIYDELKENPEELSFLIHEHLTDIHPDLVFDIPFEQVDHAYQLIISADGDSSLFQTVFDLCEQAPRYTRWHIISLRPRTSQQDQAIELDGLYLEYEDIFYKTTNDDLPMELEIYIKGYDKLDNRYIHGYFLLLDTLLGEYDAVTYTETIKVEPYFEEENLKRFITLREAFDNKAQKKNNA